MRLLVPTRISLALRGATGSPVPHVARAARAAPKQRGSKVFAAAAPLQREENLQQLYELSKQSRDELDMRRKRQIQEILEGNMKEYSEEQLPEIVKSLSDINDVKTLEKILETDSRSMKGNDKAPNLRLVTEVLWAAAHFKSLGSCPPSIRDWIEIAVRRLDEPFPSLKELIIWLLSILRGDFPMLEQLKKDSVSKGKEVGPEIEREKIVRLTALAYLEEGKKEEFRRLWSQSRTPLLAEDENLDQQQTHAMLHHALLRSAGGAKPDPAMLRWYADLLVSHQLTPIPQKPQFETMVMPVMSALGGRIEKWTKNDKRMKKLSQWRDKYDDAQMDILVRSMLSFLKHQILGRKHGDMKDLERLQLMLDRLDNGKKRRATVVIDWLNYCGGDVKIPIQSLFPSHELIVVGREQSQKGDRTNVSPNEEGRIKVMDVTCKKEKVQEVDDICAIILAVATCGHLLSNDKTKPHISRFKKFAEETHDKSGDKLAILLKNFLNDAVIRHGVKKVQLPVDHSRAVQWIYDEKKELAFTVSRKESKYFDVPFRVIDYYSLRID